jgi:hypothetical protein
MQRPRRDGGQATLEAALSLPVVLLALLLIVQVGIVVRDVVALTQAAREGVRALAVSGDDADGRAAVVRAAGPLDGERIEIDLSPPADQRTTGSVIDVRLSYVERLSVPIVSRVVALEVPLTATASMRAERGAPSPSPTAAPP